MEMNSDMIGAGDKRLGAYFVKPSELSRDMFSEKVLKYLWDDAFRMDKYSIFDKRYTSLENVLETYQTVLGDPLQVVLKGDVYQKMLDKMKSKGAMIETNKSVEEV